MHCPLAEQTTKEQNRRERTASLFSHVFDPMTRGYSNSLVTCKTPRATTAPKQPSHPIPHR